MNRSGVNKNDRVTPSTVGIGLGFTAGPTSQAGPPVVQEGQPMMLNPNSRYDPVVHWQGRRPTKKTGKTARDRLPEEYRCPPPSGLR